MCGVSEPEWRVTGVGICPGMLMGVFLFCFEWFASRVFSCIWCGVGGWPLCVCIWVSVRGVVCGRRWAWVYVWSGGVCMCRDFTVVSR